MPPIMVLANLIQYFTAIDNIKNEDSVCEVSWLLTQLNAHKIEQMNHIYCISYRKWPTSYDLTLRASLHAKVTENGMTR